MKKNKKQKTKRKSFADFVRHPFIRRNKPMLHTVEWLLVLLAFFAVGFPMIYSDSSKNIFLEGKLMRIGVVKESFSPPTIEEKKFIGEEIAEPVDTTAWDTYRNQWYGFEIQHPDSWTDNTQYKTATEKSAKYEIIYKFRKDEENAGDVFAGYDVKIYSVKKVQNIENTNEIHKKETAPTEPDQCQLSLEEEKLKSEGLTFKKISVNEDDSCYEPAYFYSFTNGNYIYNIVPAVGESGERFATPEKETIKIFPEYKEAISSFKSISISRPASTAPSKPKITARRPVSAKVVNGKLVCAKKNDKPRKSKQNKPGHLDLECCLDPDETPNPWCTY